MKLLVVAYLFPYPHDGGYKLRVYNTIRELSVAHDIDLICTEDREIERRHVAHMEARCRSVTTMRKPAASTLRKLVRYGRGVLSGCPIPLISSWDVEKVRVVRERIAASGCEAVIAEHLLAGHLVHQCRQATGRGAATVMVNHNVEHALYASIHGGAAERVVARPYHRWQADVLRRYERAVNEAAGLCVAMSAQDEGRLRELSPGLKPLVLPNGVDPDYFAMRGALPANHDFYFVGDYGYYPNSDAVCRFVADIFPRVRSRVADARLWVVGRNPPREIRGHDAVVVAGYVEDVREYANRCRAAIVPLRHGGGTRLKILEAMSMGVPIVSTAKGAEGLRVAHDSEMLIADDDKSFADALCRVLTDDSLARRLAATARGVAVERYGWKAVCGRLSAALSEAREAGRAREGARP